MDEREAARGVSSWFGDRDGGLEDLEPEASRVYIAFTYPEILSPLSYSIRVPVLGLFSGGKGCLMSLCHCYLALRQSIEGRHTEKRGPGSCINLQALYFGILGSKIGRWLPI